MTAQEVIEGIVNNEKAKQQSFCILREIEYDSNNKKLNELMKREGFCNKSVNDDRELCDLKVSVKEILPNSVMKFKVNLFLQ